MDVSKLDIENDLLDFIEYFHGEERKNAVLVYLLKLKRDNPEEFMKYRIKQI